MATDVLLVDGGGRGHAIAWKLRQSPHLGNLYVAPGNAGTIQVAENVPINATNIDGLLEFALEKKIGLTVVGQDDPLAMGIVDAFQAKGLRIFGPTKLAAEIESSKVFSKNLMVERRIPTASHAVFTSFDDASEFIEGISYPLMVKADGLSLGKGAYACRTLADAQYALQECIVHHVHGSAGKKVIIEKFVEGPEISIHAFCDGAYFKLLPSAQDHKPIFDSDKGPNTGGMGTIAPVPWFKDYRGVREQVMWPIMNGLREAGRPFVGLLYPGLKISGDDLNVLEFNARFGDPETQVYMRLLKSDLLEIFEACVNGRLRDMEIEWYPWFAACIVMASEGYPSNNYKKGVRIDGIWEAEQLPEVVVFHAGTKFDDHGHFVTSGGRVLGVTAVGPTLQVALARAYNGVARIHLDGMQFRKDIGARSLAIEI